MPSDKDRLYVALYVRGGTPKMPGGDDIYHWALMEGPKSENEGGTGTRFHAKERLVAGGTTEWQCEELTIPLQPTNMLLVRILVGKIANSDRLLAVLRKVPIRHGEPGWNCVTWVKESLQKLKADGKALGTAVTEWDTVRDAAMSYCQKKKDQHRFDGKAEFDMARIATFDLIENRETVP